MLTEILTASIDRKSIGDTPKPMRHAHVGNYPPTTPIYILVRRQDWSNLYTVNFKFKF